MAAQPQGGARLTGLRLVVVALSAVGLITTSAALELFRFGEVSAALNAKIIAATEQQDAVTRLSQSLATLAIEDNSRTRQALVQALDDDRLSDAATAARLAASRNAARSGGDVPRDLPATVVALATDARNHLGSEIALWDEASTSVSRVLSLSLASIVVLLFTVVLRTLVYLSARDRTEAQLRSATAEAERANRAKSDFLATMSHEIRTPLTAIRGYADLLAGGSLTAAQRDQLDRLRDANGALAMLIDDILDLSKIEAGQFDLHIGPVDLPALVDRVAGLVRPSASAKGLVLAASVAVDVPRFIMADSGRLMQVLLNLANNAVKFTPAGEVTLAVCLQGGQVQLAVTDTGIGIAADDLQKLFKRFSQIDNSLSRTHAGTGLGLAISCGLVKRMGGEIGVESEAGVGTTFTVTLPLVVATAPPETITKTAPLPQRRAARILVVEDSPQNQDLIQAVLRRDGHGCTPAFDGAEGVAAARSGGFDLVIMDMQMPRMDGIAATAAIRALPAPHGAVPILALSANALPHQVAAMAQAGADSHLAKPFAIDDMSRAVAALLLAAPLPQTGLTDPASLDALAGLLGCDWVKTRLHAVMGGLGWTEADLPLPDLRRNAHRLISESGQLGLSALGEAAARLEQAIDAGAPVDACRTALRQAALATRAELPVLVARLDAPAA